MIKVRTEIIKAGILMLALLLYKSGAAQTPGLGSWSVLNAELSLSEKWSLFGEAQLRSQKFFNHFSYHEMKGGISYSISDKAEVLLGIGQYVTYDPTGNFKSPVAGSEFRIWEQFTLTNNLNRVKLEHRYRIEQKFTGGDYRNRFRYRINAIVPINTFKVQSKTFYATAFEEIFLTNTSPYFQRNRLFGGVGYVFNDIFTFQAGLVKQFDFSSDLTYYSKNMLQLTLMFDLKTGGSERERHPSSMD